MPLGKPDFVRVLAGLRWALAVGTVLHGGAARAGPKEDAAEHYDQGLQLAEKGSYAEAIIEFQKAYALSPHPSALFSLAQVHAATGDSVRAVDLFRRYMAAAGSTISAARRTEVEQEIQEQEARIGVLAISTKPAGATIAIDGLVVGSTPFSEAPRVNSGTHQVTAVLAGHRSGEQSVTIVGGEQLEIDLVLEPIQTEAVEGGESLQNGSLRISCARPQMTVTVDGRHLVRTPLQATLREPVGRHKVVFGGLRGDQVFWVDVRSSGVAEVACSETDARRSPRDAGTFPFRTLGYVTGAAGLALGGVALGHYLWNKERYDTWRAADRTLQKEAWSADHRERQIHNNTLANSIEQASVVTVALASAGGVLVAGGTLLALSHPSGARPRAFMPQGLVIAGSSASWTVSW